MKPPSPTLPLRYRDLAETILGCAIEVHRTDLKSMNLEVGLLLNFNAATLKNGIRRLIRDPPNGARSHESS